jgi:hypothetical protein
MKQLVWKKSRQLDHVVAMCQTKNVEHKISVKERNLSNNPTGFQSGTKLNYTLKPDKD